MLDFRSNVMLNDRMVSALIDGEMVMMDMDSGSYFGLNSVGTYIWELLKEKRKIEEIADAVVRTFDVEKETSDKELVEFLEKLLEENLLIVS